MGKIIKLERRGLPRRGGYLVLETAVIAAYYKQLHSHSADLYAFRFLGEGKAVSLMYGSLQGANSKVNVSDVVEEHSPELLDTLVSFSIAEVTTAKRANKTILHVSSDEHIVTIAVACDRGAIVGGWYNSDADSDIGKQMLAYILYSFAALNGTGQTADTILKERAYDTIPRDSRYGKFDVNIAQTTLIEELAIFQRGKRKKN